MHSGVCFAADCGQSGTANVSRNAFAALNSRDACAGSSRDVFAGLGCCASSRRSDGTGDLLCFWPMALVGGYRRQGKRGWNCGSWRTRLRRVCLPSYPARAVASGHKAARNRLAGAVVSYLRVSPSRWSVVETLAKMASGREGVCLGFHQLSGFRATYTLERALAASTLICWRVTAGVAVRNGTSCVALTMSSGGNRRTRERGRRGSWRHALGTPGGTDVSTLSGRLNGGPSRVAREGLVMTRAMVSSLASPLRTFG